MPFACARGLPMLTGVMFSGLFSVELRIGRVPVRCIGGYRSNDKGLSRLLDRYH